MGEQTVALAALDGWHAEGRAARVHYRGATEDDAFSVEFYADPVPDPDGDGGAVLYWRVSGDDQAVPVAREAVPTPLRERVRQDLAAADIDPDAERRSL